MLYCDDYNRRESECPSDYEEEINFKDHYDTNEHVYPEDGPQEDESSYCDGNLFENSEEDDHMEHKKNEESYEHEEGMIDTGGVDHELIDENMGSDYRGEGTGWSASI
jgi:hypothetical protein